MAEPRHLIRESVFRAINTGRLVRKWSPTLKCQRFPLLWCSPWNTIFLKIRIKKSLNWELATEPEVLLMTIWGHCFVISVTWISHSQALFCFWFRTSTFYLGRLTLSNGQTKGVYPADSAESPRTRVPSLATSAVFGTDQPTVTCRWQQQRREEAAELHWQPHGPLTRRTPCF